MDIQKTIQDYLKQPIPLWENEITELLVNHKWALLNKQSQIIPNTYSITGCVIQGQSVTEANLSLPSSNTTIKIAVPSKDLKGFYDKHGIKPVEIDIIDSASEIAKISSALSILKKIKPVHDFITKIVKSVQLIKTEYPDTDVSYSHPEIPFSIFFSVCDEVSHVSDLRVAESILHEAMHLKLTLIESHVDLIEPNSTEIFYSPWRDEERPLRGVLHGIFVFKAIKDFYKLLFKKYLNNSIEVNFIKFRIEEIEKELELLKKFPNCRGLTICGKKLTKEMLRS